MATTESFTEINLPVCDEEEQGVRLNQRAQWLRAAILGANDGLLSTASLMLGVGAAREDQSVMILSGLAGAVAGACSMAVGEFVSVSTQREIQQRALKESDSETAACRKDGGVSVKLDVTSESIPATKDLAISSPVTAQLNAAVEASQPNFWLSPGTPMRQITVHAPSSTRSPFMKVIARDTQSRQDDGAEEELPNPYKAAGASALSFLCGSAIPILSAVVFSQDKLRIFGIVIVASIALAIIGGTGAYLGGSSVGVSSIRVLLGGWISMGITYGLLKPLDRYEDNKSND